MSDNLLFFISIVVRALQSPDVERALRDAFREIKKKGSEERYAEGFNNFKLFMDAVCCRHDAMVNYYIHELIALLGTGMFEGILQEKESLLNIINSHPQWKAEHEAFCRMEAHEDLTQDFPVIEVLNEKGFVRELTFTKPSGCKSIDNIVPGNYQLKLVNTGWLIWEGHLAAEKLISFEAHKNKNISLAAGAPIPTGEIDLLNNEELILRTYAGPESGCIKIELIGKENLKNE